MKNNEELEKLAANVDRDLKRIEEARVSDNLLVKLRVALIIWLNKKLKRTRP